MKYTVICPSLTGNNSDVGVVSAWQVGIGELVQAGDTLAVVIAGNGSVEAAEFSVVSPAFGILAKKIVLPGEAIESGEPIALLTGVPEPLVPPGPVPEAFAKRPPYIPGGAEEAVPLSPTAQAVARHMAQSRRVSPHVDTVAVADLGEVMRLRERVAPGLREREGIEIGILPFVVGAVAASLERFPAVNAERINDGAEIRRKRYVHIGLSVPTSGDGLAVPVVRDANTKSILVLAREVDDLLERAVARRLAPIEMRGATFTIAPHLATATLPTPNILYQTPILHSPQAAILSLGAVTKAPVVSDDEQVVVRPVLHLCLSHDARVVDATTAAAFLSDVAAGLQEARFLFP